MSHHEEFHLYTFFCKQCKKAQIVSYGRMIDIPDGWIRLTRKEDVLQKDTDVCSIGCAMAQLSDWYNEIEQKWRWAL